MNSVDALFVGAGPFACPEQPRGAASTDYLKFIFLILITCLLTACASTKPPSNPENICSIFTEKKGWYKAAKKAEKRWGSKAPVLLSIMYQESQFKHNARPGRIKILWIIPGPRKSDAFGYAQAKDDVWGEYQKTGGSIWSRRDSFADAIDFIGWYNAQSKKRSSIGINDANKLYLAYHEGHGGYNRQTYKSKSWLMNTARKVADRSLTYSRQLQTCEKKLSSGWWFF
jgi:hypothetical protein